MHSKEQKIAEQLRTMKDRVTQLASEIGRDLESQDLSQLNGVATSFHADFEELVPELVQEEDISRKEDPALLTDRLSRLFKNALTSENFSQLNSTLGVLEEFQHNLNNQGQLSLINIREPLSFEYMVPQDPALTTGQEAFDWIQNESLAFRHAITQFIEKALADQQDIDDSQRRSRISFLVDAAFELFENEICYGLLQFSPEINHALFTDNDPSGADAYLKDSSTAEQLINRKTKISLEILGDSLMLTIESPGQFSNCEELWEKSKSTLAEKTEDFFERSRGRGEFLASSIFPELIYSEEGSGSKRVYLGPLHG